MGERGEFNERVSNFVGYTKCLLKDCNTLFYPTQKAIDQSNITQYSAFTTSRPNAVNDNQRQLITGDRFFHLLKIHVETADHVEAACFILLVANTSGTFQGFFKTAPRFVELMQVIV